MGGVTRPRDPSAAPDLARPIFEDDRDWNQVDGERLTVDVLLAESIGAPPTLRMDLPARTGGVSARPARDDSKNANQISFTKLELPTFDTFETAVTFDPTIDPLTAHDSMVPLFGQKAGQGKFLFGADSAVPGRFWVRSTAPWEHMPVIATTALEPKRVAIQLAPGLMHHFTVPMCVGEETIANGRKHVRSYTSDAEYLRWFEQSAPHFGFKPLMVCAELRTMRFRHGEAAYRIDYAVLEGAIEVVDTDLLLQRLLRGFGAHRRAGLGMMKITA
jgi:CRISPR-associated protein Cas6/Cse3/CasE subtype I-E